MNQIFFLFLLFCMLFILEYKAINILMSFVGIIITLSIELAYNKGLEFIEGEYFSYILILVQVSALTILFGFIIMLYPTLPIGFKQPITLLNNKLLDVEKKEELKIVSISDNIKSIFKSKLTYIIILFFLLYIKYLDYNIIYNYIYTFFNPNHNFINLGFTLINLSDINLFSNPLLDNYHFLDLKKLQDFSIFEQNTDFLRKLGLSFYTNDNIIIQLIVLTIILLFAIIALFFLVNI